MKMKMNTSWVGLFAFVVVMAFSSSAYAKAQFTETGRTHFFDRFESHCVEMEKEKTPVRDNVEAFCSCVRKHLSDGMTQNEVMGMIHDGTFAESIAKKKAEAESVCKESK